MTSRRRRAIWARPLLTFAPTVATFARVEWRVVQRRRERDVVKTAGAKSSVLALARDIGFDAIDGGPLRNARLLEPLGYFNIQLGYALGMGTQIGLKLQHP